MAADLTAYDAILKTVYPRQLVDLLNSDVPIYNSFRKYEKEMWEGKDTVEWPLRVGRNEGFGFGRPRGPIAEAQSQQFTPIKVPLRFGWGRINIDAPTMKVAKTNRGSFKRVLQTEMDGLREDFTDDMNRIIWGDGRGVLALVNVAGTDTTTLTVDSPGGVAGANNGARFLQRNQKIAILSADGSAVTAVRRVATIAAAGTSVTVNAPLSAVQAPDNGIIVRAPNLTLVDVADTSYQREPMGLLGMIDDGTYVNNYFSVNRTTFEVAKSAVLSSVGALNLDVIQQGIDVAAQLGKGKIQEHWMHHSVRRSYLAILVANRRYLSTSGANNHDGGFKGAAIDSDPEFAGKPVKVDKDAPYNTWFGLDTRYGINFENSPGEWVDEDGAILSRIHGSDVFEAVWRWFGNFAYEKPNASFRLDGVNANLVIIHVR